MNFDKWNDSFILGVVTGLISLIVIYFLINSLRLLLIEYYGNPYMMKPPTVQMISIVINIIIFRFLIINFDKEKTGRGFLFITVIVSLGYFYFYNRIKQ